MKDDHIISELEKQPLANVSSSDLEIITAHTAHCARCLSAYEAARASSSLLQERASTAIDPPPFFQTRVMRAIREQNQALEPFGFLKMWQAARTLVTSMALLVVLLSAMTYYSNHDLGPDKSNSRDLAIYGPETLADDEITYGEVLTGVYDFDAEGMYEK